MGGGGIPLGDRLSAAERHRRQAAERQARLSQERREIGPLPAVENRRRRRAAEKSLRKFCETYFRDRFYLKWSADHLKVLEFLESSVRERSLFALAMPRGTGKTSLAECAVLWAVLIGSHEYAVLLGASQKQAEKRIANLKTALSFNEKLAADFPEVCHPIRALEGLTARTAGQTLNGKKTQITWGRTKIVLPTVPGSPASSAILEAGGLLTALRGLVETRPDGRQVRPTFCVIDDPQTRRSARSESQTEQRERIISGDLLYLPGADQKTSVVLLCTVIEKGDLASRFLDRERNPEWRAFHAKALYSLPKNLKLWDEYAQILHDELLNGGDGKQAARFYRRNRKAMDDGAEVAWPQRKFAGDVSALQSLMNLRIRDPESFAAEMQNSPLEPETQKVEFLTAEEIAKKQSGYARRTFPNSCDLVTAFIDVQKELLYWAAVAWDDKFTGYVLDYGTYPEQGISYFSSSDPRRTLSKKFKGVSLEGRLAKALTSLADELDAKDWIRSDGARFTIDFGLIDAGWGLSTETVYAWVRQRGRVWMPSHGRYIGASKKPVSEYRKKPGERIGLNWVMPAASRGRGVRYVWFDANFWKTFLQQRLASPVGEPGSLSLFSDRPSKHRLLADHLTSEFGVETQGLGRTCVEWRLKFGRRENHWLDALVGCCVAASIRGKKLNDLTPAGETGKPKKRKRRPRVSYL